VVLTGRLLLFKTSYLYSTDFRYLNTTTSKGHTRSGDHIGLVGDPEMAWMSSIIYTSTLIAIQSKSPTTSRVEKLNSAVNIPHILSVCAVSKVKICYRWVSGMFTQSAKPILPIVNGLVHKLKDFCMALSIY
jgi:hypothetical protein